MSETTPKTPIPRRSLALVTLVVPDYDEAIAYYCGVLGFELIEDEDQVRKRWVVVRPSEHGANILLARASSAAQTAHIGDQTGGRVGFFLHTTDFLADHAMYVARGVKFLEAPRLEDYGMVAKFADRYGNIWDLLEPA